MSDASPIITPLCGGLGAEITDVDLPALVENDGFDIIQQALLDHLVIVIRDQSMTPAQHLAAGRRFGSLNVHDFVDGLADHPEIIEIIKQPDESGYNFGGTWHSDVSYLAEPSMASLLYAREVPPYGGDTLFSNMYLAYESLSTGLRELLEDKNAVHSPKEIYGLESRRGDQRAGRSRSMSIGNETLASGEVVHPVVRTHPQTGRRLLYVNANFTMRFENMTEEESAPLLGYLFQHLQRPEFTCRIQWREDTLTIWDNRCTQHLAVNDYDGFRRRMHRVTVNGDRPFRAPRMPTWPD